MDMPPAELWWVPVLATPFLVLLGVAIKAIIDRVTAKDHVQVSERQVDVSEKEADTHAFQALIDGFNVNLIATEKRAIAAEQRAHAVEQKYDGLDNRVGVLERQKKEMIDHIEALERLIPNPPGVPPRPLWQ